MTHSKLIYESMKEGATQVIKEKDIDLDLLFKKYEELKSVWGVGDF